MLLVRAVRIASELVMYAFIFLAPFAQNRLSPPFAWSFLVAGLLATSIYIAFRLRASYDSRKSASSLDLRN